MSAVTLESTKCESRREAVERRDPAPADFTVAIDLRRLVRFFAAVIALLLASGTAANIISNQVASSSEDKLARLMNRFDIGFEPSIPNWYSSCTLLGCSLLLGLITAAAWRNGDRWRWHWLMLAGLFLALSIDEGVRFHEMLHTVMAEYVETTGLLYFPWVIPALIFVGIVGATCLPFLWHLPRRTSLLFMAAGATFVIGAVGMDMIGGVIVEQRGMESLEHSIAQLFEELGEMLGVLLFLYALLDHLRTQIGSIRVRVC